jgi:hypothetical protein
MLILRHKRKRNVAFEKEYYSEGGYMARADELPEGGFNTVRYYGGAQMKGPDSQVRGSCG